MTVAACDAMVFPRSLGTKLEGILRLDERAQTQRKVTGQQTEEKISIGEWSFNRVSGPPTRIEKPAMLS